MKNLYYRIYLGCFPGVGFNHKVDHVADTLLRKSMKSGIKYISSGACFMYITFKDGVKTKLWNVNKYYAWLSRGYIGNYNYDCGRPTVKTMYELIQLLKTI
jgi:hypothetical protein